MKLLPPIAVALIALLTPAGSALLPRAAFADGGGVADPFEDTDHDRARDLVERGDIHRLADILAAVGKSYPGEVVSVHLLGDGQHWQYRLVVLEPMGRRIVLVVDAATMAVIPEGTP